MKLALSVLEMDFIEVEKRIKRFIREYIEKAGASGVVLGLSGGIDSSTVAALSSLSIGGDRVLGLIIPEEETYSLRDIDDAKFVAEKFGIETQICDITAVLKGFYKSISIFDPAVEIAIINVSL